jgi:hypothetical protein
MFAGGAQAGLQELTLDISKLVNLKELVLQNNGAVKYIPESISCLQKLEHLHIYKGQIDELPDGLSTLNNLASLELGCLNLEDYEFPDWFQVT